VKNAEIRSDPDVNQAVLKDLLKQIDNVQTQKPAAVLPNIRRTIMKSPITKLAAAVVLALAVTFGLLQVFGPFRTGGTAYGMTDLSAWLGSARTLHVQSTCWLYQPDANQAEFEKATVIPSELWVDVPNLRTHFLSYMSRSTPKGESGLSRLEGVRDQQHSMDIDHTRKRVAFHKASIVQRRLEVREEIQNYLHHITEEQLEQFVRVGQESINGTLYDIWEREQADIHKANTRAKTRCWLAPATGELGRIYTWAKHGDGNWRLGWCADTIERDIDIPDSIFAFKAPEGYKHENTLETAYEGEGLGRGWYVMGRARVSVAINFTLEDGTAIVAWHADDVQKDHYQEQGHLFQDLVPGGELPKLPMVVYGLKTVRVDSYSPPEVVYTGRHLAFTKKNRWHYEWALYVPNEPLPSSPGPRLYRMLCRFNLPDEQPPQVGNPLPENKIGPGEFDQFVREAMAELSDDGKAPEHVTRENVTQWAKEIRTAFGK
jgi:hypothetical protein